MGRELPLDMFDAAERRLVIGVLDHLTASPDEQLRARERLVRLARVGDAVRSYPSLYLRSELGGTIRGPETLIEHLCSLQPGGSALDLPAQAALARGFLIAKIQALRGLLRAVEACPPPSGSGAAGAETNGAAELEADLRREVGQSIFTLLAEELLLEVVADPAVAEEPRRRGAEELVRYWDGCIEVEIDDFCPLLESAWQARNRMVVDYGTLLGSSEMLRLGEAASDPRLFDAIADEVDTEQKRFAFEEFLFGLSWEQLEVLRTVMQREGRDSVDRQWVARTLSISEQDLFSGVSEPEAMLTSYRQRHAGALHRRLRDGAGPQRTAETYLVRWVLQHPDA